MNDWEDFMDYSIGSSLFFLGDMNGKTESVSCMRKPKCKVYGLHIMCEVQGVRTKEWTNQQVYQSWHE